MAYWLRSSTVSAITIALLVLPSILAPVAGNAQTRDSAFQFGILGDMPYTKVQEPEYRRVLEALNRADLAFVVHIGDLSKMLDVTIQFFIQCRASMKTSKRSCIRF